MTIEEMRTNLALATDEQNLLDKFEDRVKLSEGNSRKDFLIRIMYEALMITIATLTMSSLDERITFYIENGIDYKEYIGITTI